jgi:hypothetical protein
MLDPLRRPRVLDAARQTLDDPEPALDLRQHQHVSVRGQASTVKDNLHRLARHG